jgi:hypothetical protein
LEKKRAAFYYTIIIDKDTKKYYHIIMGLRTQSKTNDLLTQKEDSNEYDRNYRQ